MAKAVLIMTMPEACRFCKLRYDYRCFADGGRRIMDKDSKPDWCTLKECDDTELDLQQVQELKERDTAKRPVPDGDVMICPVCGSAAYPWSRFCSECGQKWWEE